MSDDALFDSEIYDDALFDEFDRLQEAKLQPPQRAPSPIEISDDEFDLSFNFDEQALLHAEEEMRSRRSNIARTVQTTLHGDILAPTSTNIPKPPSHAPLSRPGPPTSMPSAPPKKTKQWDQTAYAKSGQRKLKGKAKKRATADEENDEDSEFEQFPAQDISSKCFPRSPLVALTISASWVCIQHLTPFLTHRPSAFQTGEHYPIRASFIQNL